MLFKCKNCGGNTVYSPVKKTMCCPHCDGLDSEEKIPSAGMSQCPSCGAPIEPGVHTSAMRCPNCGTSLIFEERVENNFKPDMILPFMVGKDQAADLLRTEFAKRKFTPVGFLSNASLDKMEGKYVPFFMYDYDTNINYHATGIKVRTWSDSTYDYREESYYDVVRLMDARFEKVPVDASDEMDDKLMDLMEPYNYRDLKGFEEKYMSGFLGEKYNHPSNELAPRAVEKVNRDSNELLNQTLTGYSSFRNEQKGIHANLAATKYALLPVWEYTFGYFGKDYKFQVNGQTGKVVGVTPVDKGQVVAYGVTWFGLVTLAGMMIRMIMSVL